MTARAIVADNSSSMLAERVTHQIGSDRVRAPIGREANAARVVVEPASVEEISELVRLCETDRISLAAMGASRTLAQIRRLPVEIGVSLNRLAKIVAYEPDDMTIVAEAGITVGDLNSATGVSRQRLPVDPCNPALTTLGALISASHAGPLRLSEGTVRDLLIGIRFVGHGGALIHGGGRVVKNVAGYDLMKVLGGAYGTLGIVTEATFKVRPIPPQYCLAIIPYDRAVDAFNSASKLHNALPLSHLEVLSPEFTSALGATDKFLLLAGFSGTPLEIGYQAGKIRDQLKGPVGILEGENARASYERVRDLDFSSAPLSVQLSVPPARLARAIDECGGEFRAHAGSGVAQIVLANVSSAESARATTQRCRAIARSERGNLAVLAAAPEFRVRLEFFDTPNDGALALMRKLKASFDPSGIFNPGCFVGGI